MLRIKWELLLMAIICWQRGHTDNHEAKKSLGHVTVVVVGGTGDLARKYLWQGFFQLYADQVGKGHTFSFYGGGLSPTENGTLLLFGILKELACPPELSAERCTLVKDQFLHLSKYHQLKTTEDYEKLSQQIKQQLGQEGMVEAGRLFYLSVPAFAYADIAEKINNTCRPPSDAWLRVVLEKPFGHNVYSAQALDKKLSDHLKEKEMYRIDHYLGKQVQCYFINIHHCSKVWH